MIETSDVATSSQTRLKGGDISLGQHLSLRLMPTLPDFRGLKAARLAAGRGPDEAINSTLHTYAATEPPLVILPTSHPHYPYLVHNHYSGQETICALHLI